jgi:hypothetical protein
VQASGCRVAVWGIGGRSRRVLSNPLAGFLVAKASTTNGHMQRGTGIIQDELYAGRIVWNKARLLGPRLSVLDEERKQLARELNVEPAGGDVISLHPAVLARYEQQLVDLQDALSKGIDAGDSEAAEAIREPVETATEFRTPSHPSGITMELSDA